jgi:WD40 repeat protein
VPAESAFIFPAVDLAGSRLAWAEGRRVRIARLERATLDLATATSIENDDLVAAQVFDEQGRQLAISDKAGKVRVWSLESDPPELTRTLTGKGGLEATVLMFDPSGSMLSAGDGLWDLTAPPDSEPIGIVGGFGHAFDPTSKWIATSGGDSVALWPLARVYPRVLRRHEDLVLGMAFTPDGSQLVSTSRDGSVRVWPLADGAGERHRILHQAEGTYAFHGQPAMAPDGSFVVTGNPLGQVIVLPLDGGPVRELSGFTDVIGDIAVGPRSRLVAAGAGGYIREEAFVRVWDLESGEVRTLDAADGMEIRFVEFTADGDLWVNSGSALRRWALDGDQPRIVEELDLSNPELAGGEPCDFDPDNRRLLLRDDGRLWIHDMVTHESYELSSHSDPNTGGFCGLDPSRELVISSHLLGMVRVGPVTGEEPHLLTGHEGYVGSVAVAPDRQWIATGDNDGTIRLWPMPDLSKPPFHTLPRPELIARLKALTNFRAVRDPESSLGWDIEIGPFPGWETVPTW